MIEVDVAAGIVRIGRGAETDYGYDGADRINSLAQSLTGSGAVTWTMAYDPSSAIVSREASNTTYLWHGGAASTAYAANGLNQYTTAGGATLSYTDSRANLTSLSASGPTFSFDTANDLLSASGPTAVSMTYDPAGRIQTKTSGGTTETFLYAGSMLVGEYSTSGAILDRYVPGPAQDEATLWYSGAGTATPQWLHADQQGSTIAWSNSSGASLGTQAYDPNGQPSAWSGPRYAYTGQLMIAEAQLYHYKARAYDPALGRFLQTDPAGYVSDMNPYAYVAGSPVNGVDPSGMDPTQPDPLVQPIDGTEPPPAFVCSGTCSNPVGPGDPSTPGSSFSCYGCATTTQLPSANSPEIDVGPNYDPIGQPLDFFGFGVTGSVAVAVGGGSGRACPGGVVQSALRGLGSFTQAVGNGEQAIGLGAAGVGAAAGIGGGVTGDVPLAGFGVLLFGAASETVAEGEVVSKTGTFLSAAGGDFSGVAPTPLEYLASRIPGVRNLSEPLRAAINQGIDKAAEPISNALGCH